MQSLPYFTIFDKVFSMLKEIVMQHIKEKEPESSFTVLVLGAACSGKTTVLRHFHQEGFSVRTEPDNPIFPLFIENPKKYAYQNQFHKMAQLMQLEILDTKAHHLSNPHFRESGIIATQIYNQYLKDQGLIDDYEYALLSGIYNHHLETFPKPDLVVFLYADDETIKKRALVRDGLVAHDPTELTPYWERLLNDLEKRGMEVYRLNTGESSVEQTKSHILQKAQEIIG